MQLMKHKKIKYFIYVDPTDDCYLHCPGIIMFKNENRTANVFFF